MKTFYHKERDGSALNMTKSKSKMPKIRGLRAIAKGSSVTYHEESWNYVASGLQGLLDGEAINPDHNSPSNHIDDYGFIDYSFEEYMEAFFQLESSAKLMPSNDLLTPALSGSSQSPGPAGNGTDFTVNTQRVPSRDSVGNEMFCYGMVSHDPHDSDVAVDSLPPDLIL